jgi:hypothetical protein
VSVRILPTIAAVALLAACSAQSSGGAGSAGLYGVVFVHPATPVCHRGMPCSKPAPGVRLVFWRNGRRAATTKTDARGRYRIQLRQGRYAVRVGPRAVKPANATVPSGRFARRNFTYDAGIR